MKGRLLILGCGGHGRVVADAAANCGYEDIAFLDDAYGTSARLPSSLLGPTALLADLVDEWPSAIVGVGNNAIRQALFQRLQTAGYKTPPVIHPSAVVSRNVRIGAGVFIAPGAVVNTGTQIADAAIVNTGARIDHDCIIGAASHIAPGATLSGGVTLGQRVWLGTGCSVKQGVMIGEDALVGVGAAVVGNLAGYAAYVGVPARVFSESC